MMICPRCNTEMTNTTGGNYYCQKCGFAVNDLVYRGYKESTTIPDIAIEKITPNVPDNKPVLSLTGWICPKCNRGISPFVNICPCTNYTSNLISVNINGTALNNENISKAKVQDICDGKLKYNKPEVDKHIQDVIDNMKTTPLTSKIDYDNQCNATTTALNNDSIIESKI